MSHELLEVIWFDGHKQPQCMRCHEEIRTNCCWNSQKWQKSWQSLHETWLHIVRSLKLKSSGKQCGRSYVWVLLKESCCFCRGDALRDTDLPFISGISQVCYLGQILYLLVFSFLTDLKKGANQKILNILSTYIISAILCQWGCSLRMDLKGLLLPMLCVWSY